MFERLAAIDDRLVPASMKGQRAHQADIARDLVAMGRRRHRLARSRRLEVVDTQIQGRDTHTLAECRNHRHPAGRVDDRRDHAAVQHTGGGITRQPRSIGHAQDRPGMFEMHDLDTQKLVVW